jgi:hypothetical protein
MEGYVSLPAILGRLNIKQDSDLNATTYAILDDFWKAEVTRVGRFFPEQVSSVSETYQAPDDENTEIYVISRLLWIIRKSTQCNGELMSKGEQLQERLDKLMEGQKEPARLRKELERIDYRGIGCYDATGGGCNVM